jgi:uncharacterized membrane protein YjfL (UPF0719 family)
MLGEQILAAIIWTTLAVVISQAVSIGVMWGLGLSPKQMVHEIEDVQNPAVGAMFFVISLAVALYIGVYFSSGYSPIEASFGRSALWFVAGLVIAHVYVVLTLEIAHRLMGRVNNETTYQYLRRELIDEQNISLALFLGGLTITPFIAVVFQII